MKWYVLQVTTGKELDVLLALAQIGYRSLVPQEQRYIRSGSVWTQKPYVLFDGYVFIQCDYNADVYYAINSVPNFIKWLGVGKAAAVPLKPLEAEWILLLSNKGQPLPPSVVTIKGGNPIYEDGILSYIPSKVTKLDKHARKAYVSLDIAGKTHKITLSVDITDDYADTNVSDADVVDSSPTAEVTDKEQ